MCSKEYDETALNVYVLQRKCKEDYQYFTVKNDPQLMFMIIYHIYVQYMQFWSVKKHIHTHTHVSLCIVARFGLLVLFGTNHYFSQLRNIFCIATLYENYNNNAGQTVLRTSIPSSTTISLYLYGANRVQLENYYLIFSILLSDTV